MSIDWLILIIFSTNGSKSNHKNRFIKKLKLKSVLIYDLDDQIWNCQGLTLYDNISEARTWKSEYLIAYVYHYAESSRAV